MAKREFKMHPKLLVDVIKRQAGTIQKAVLEGVMNSIEAGASKVTVKVEPRKIEIDDDGRGFRNADEIEKFFETFGQPHAESEGKIWAQFRMGRGQMFAFGRNEWRTGKFRMLVDVNNMMANGEGGLGYDLQTLESDHKGCNIKIDLYEPLADNGIYFVVREIANYVKYVSIPVLVNDKQVNTPPDSKPWGPESNDDAYIKLASGDSYRGLEVYNLGVLVETCHRADIGIGGTVVTKKRLDVNFARNQVMASDPLWKRIKKVIEASAGLKKVKEKLNLSYDERVAMIRRFLAGEDIDVMKLRLLGDTRGRAWSVNEILKKFQKFTVAERHNDIADKLIQRNLCLVIDAEWVEMFECDPKDLFKRLTGAKEAIAFVKFEDAARDVQSKYCVLPKEEWTAREHSLVKLIESICVRYGKCHEVNIRKVRVGDSPVADAWTDGVSYVCFSRGYLRHCHLESRDRPHLDTLMDLAELICHEYAHDKSSGGSHGHDPEFYETFHDKIGGFLDAAVWLTHDLTPQRLEWLKNYGKQRGKDVPEPETPIEVPTVAIAARTSCSPAPGLPDGISEQEWTVWKSYHGNGGDLAYKAIEKTFKLKEAHGMTACRIIRKVSKALAERVGK